MPLPGGTRFGPYEVLAPLGAGGMGEVYRARDTRLAREVALKVLPPDAADDPDARERLVREARAIAALTHPNICRLYDVGSENDVDYLVMELLDGESLDARLSRGPLPVDAALHVGAEIAAAVGAAHRAGVIHRDLKPGNVMLTRDGAKVLDFGVAKLDAMGLAARGTTGIVATRTTPLTGIGTLVGTINYMAPEQLEGKEADARTDLFALGAVLYEMLTGHRAFDGGSAAGVIAAILEREPTPIASVVPDVPPAVDRVVRECLAKDPEERRQSARDLARELRRLAQGTDGPDTVRTSRGASVTGAPASPPAGATERAQADRPTSIPSAAAPVARRGVSRALLGTLAIVAIVAIVALGVAFLESRRDDAEATTRVVEIEIPFEGNNTPRPVGFQLAPDESSLLYLDSLSAPARLGIWRRPLGSAQRAPVPGATPGFLPFWSPDGREIGFFANGALQAVNAAGGRPRAICPVRYGVGASWSAEGSIVFCSAFGEPLQRVSASGGTPRAITALDTSRREAVHAWPWLLPGGRRLLFLSRTLPGQPNRIESVDIEGGPRRVVAEADALAGYVAPWLLFVRSGTLFAQRFDPDRGSVSGPAQAIADNLVYLESWSWAAASARGDVLAYMTHRPAPTVGDWYDARGTRLGRAFEEDDVRGALISPDGSRVALLRFDPARGADDLWVLDLAAGARTRLTRTDADEDLGAWQRDGSGLLYVSDREGMYGVFSIDAGGAGEPRAVFNDPGRDTGVTDVARDGRWFIASADDPQTGGDLYRMALTGPRDLVPLANGPGDDDSARLSPDGRLVAYTSNRTERSTVQIRASDGSGGAIVVGEGFRPVWEPDGRGLRFTDDQARIERVALSFDGLRVRAGTPDPAARIVAPDLVAFDIAPDGRVLVVRASSPVRPLLRVLVGWQQRLH